MFSYLPFYDEATTNEEAETILIRFINTIYDIGEKHDIDLSNRFSVILGCCDKMEELLEKKEYDVWPKGKKEPIEELQELIQLMGYALADGKYLFDQPDLKEVIKTMPKIVWRDLEQRFTKIAIAFVNRSTAYKELIKIKRQLGRQSERGKVYDTEPEDMLDEKFKSIHQTLKNNTAIRWLFPTRPRTVLLNNCINNRLLIKLAPLYFLFAYLNGPDSEVEEYHYKFETFVSSLKENKKLFGEQQTVSDKEKAVLICEAFDRISSDCKRFMTNRRSIMSYYFNSYEVVEAIAKKKRISVTDEEKVSIETAVRQSFTTPGEFSVLKTLGPLVEGVTLGTIIYYFLIVYDSYSYQYGNIKHSRAKGLNKALNYIYNNGLVDEISNIPLGKKNYKDTEFTEILRVTVQEYFLDNYYLTEELFWLISGYIPPWNYSYMNREESLYALIEEYIMDFYKETKNMLWPNLEQKINPIKFDLELNNGIASVKKEFIIRKADDKDRIKNAKDFISVLYNTYKNYKLLSSVRSRCNLFCKEQFENCKTEKTKYRTSQYAEDVYVDAIMSVLIEQAFVYLRQRVFSVIVLLNRYMWPMDFFTSED